MTTSVRSAAIRPRLSDDDELEPVPVDGSVVTAVVPIGAGFVPVVLVGSAGLVDVADGDATAVDVAVTVDVAVAVDVGVAVESGSREFGKPMKLSPSSSVTWKSAPAA